jgi:hypothetical protein
MILLLPDKDKMDPTSEFCHHSKCSHHTYPHSEDVSLSASASSQPHWQKPMKSEVTFDDDHCSFSSPDPRGHWK